MGRFYSLLIKLLIIFTLFISFSFKVNAEEIDEILKKLQEDIKTLEKAVYSKDIKTTTSDDEISNEHSDIMNKHLLKI